MASGSRERTESNKDQEEQLPQISPDRGTSRKCMRGAAKALKPPKAPKKKGELESETAPEEIAEEVAQPVNEEEVAASEDQGLLSDDRPRRGDHGREPDTIAEMSDPAPYKMPP